MIFDIAIIILNYNTSEHTINCINSIIEKTDSKINYQMIIIDNCSMEDDFIQLKEFCSKKNINNFQLIRSNLNLGFGGGNMFGVQYANAKYLAFVNNDVILMNDCLTILLDYITKNPQIGIVGGQSFRTDGRFLPSFDNFASVRKKILGRHFLEFIDNKTYPLRKKLYTEPIPVDFVIGSFMLFKADIFFECGGFDTNIFLYSEESDICKRVKTLGKSTMLVPSAQYIHINGASASRSMEIKKELYISLLYVIRKHSGNLAYLFLLYFLIFKYFFSSIVKPKYWTFFHLLLIGAPLSKSLKHKQKIKPLNDKI